MRNAPELDYILLAGYVSPGKAVVAGADSSRTWDERKGYGITGAFIVFTGDGLANFDVEIQVWDDDGFDQWKEFARATLQKPAIGKRPQSMSIEHPMLNDETIGITQVVVTNVSQWSQVEDGLWSRKISFKQFRAPQPLLVKPFEGPPGNPLVAKPPIDPLDIIIADKAKQIRALSGEP